MPEYRLFLTKVLVRRTFFDIALLIGPVSIMILGYPVIGTVLGSLVVYSSHRFRSHLMFTRLVDSISISVEEPKMVKFTTYSNSVKVKLDQILPVTDLSTFYPTLYRHQVSGEADRPGALPAPEMTIFTMSGLKSGVEDAFSQYIDIKSAITSKIDELKKNNKGKVEIDENV